MHCVSRGGCYLLNSHCDVQEEDQWRKESYHASWLSLVLETRPQYRLTLSETDRVRKETYEQQQVVHLMVERSPGQTLTLGREGGRMTKHQLPFISRGREQHLTRTGKGGSDAEEVNAHTSALDLCKPVRENFRASSLMASQKEVSDRAQRRE
ncbi:telethonin [Menidia menidia]